ncbi:hypothetical protein N9O61_00550 [Octadecabacter sp.]|nr:hypothetical protein [Octadecabacter sp.]
MNNLVGFSGRQGSGKTTLSELLVREYGFSAVSVASPIKEMLLSLGLSRDEVFGSSKEDACELLCGKTPRHAMRTLGTEWGRKLIGPSLWTNVWRNRVGTALVNGKVIVDDIRFDDEADVIKKFGGTVIEIVREQADTVEHISESGISSVYIDHRHNNTVQLSDSIRQLQRHLGLS